MRQTAKIPAASRSGLTVAGSSSATVPDPFTSREKRFALLAHPLHRLVLAKPAQLEMADLTDRFGNFDGESIGHQQWPADILAEEFQPTKDVDVPPDNTEIETIARANIAVGGNAAVQSDIDGNMLLRPCGRI